jgi:SPP1 gp7 family putative phage head morphogenesis protein
MAEKPKVVRAVWPNAGVEAWYRKKLQAALQAMAESMLCHLRAAWKAADPEIGFAQDAKNPSILLRKALEKWGGLWIKKLDRLSLDLSAQFADKSFKATDTSMAAAMEQAGFTVKFTATPASRAAYQAVVAENVNLIKSIPAQFLKDVQSQVWANVMKGGDLATLSRGIQDKYGTAYKRAALIARDQNAKAKAVLENTRRQELGIKQAIWQHSSAGKVPRPTHVAMNGKTFDLAKGMYDSDEGQYVWPGQLINCRCTSRALIPGFNA